ncbi:MAG: DUF2225 domain-containing protein [Tindallia sp. MSAO_Bac2]|nr:MAG: DUF2225 domain-containing protein [Tindallia sp. MSAO_Bac2]
MDHYLFDKELDCPVCANKFKTKKPRLRKLPVQQKDPDFHIWYKELNPVYYNVWVCPNCGFSATESEFKKLTAEEKSIILKNISMKWNKRDFGGTRSIEMALETHKLALLVAQLLNKSQGYLGSICLRLAWLYREEKNEQEEAAFLKYALEYLENAYTNESFPIAGLDEVSLSYLIGELKRKTGEPQNAIFWFGRALDHPDIKFKRMIQLKAREQWQLARDAYKEQKEQAE